MSSPFLKRFALRFATVLGALLYFPTPLDLIPKLGDALGEALDKAWAGPLALAAQLFGQQLLPANPSGSGDTLRDWLRLFCIVVIAVVIGLAWAMEQKRTRDDVVQDALRDYLRFCLMAALLSYGWLKVGPLQMPRLEDFRLWTPYAESSPMGMLWRFMGFSPAYQHFSGAMEVLAGLLLLSRRTTTLGALVAAGVMTQVVMLNFCFDVPVKLYSSELLLTALFLLLPDARRLFDFLVLGRAGRAQDRVPRYFTGPRLQWVRMAPFVVCVAWVSYSTLTEDRSHPPEPPLMGEYSVVDQQSGRRLYWVSVTSWAVRLRPAEGDPVWWMGDADAQGSYTLHAPKDPKLTGDAKLEPLDGGKVHLTASLGGEAFDLTLLKRDAKRLPLMSRGFHWVQEWPVNQ